MRQGIPIWAFAAWAGAAAAADVDALVALQSDKAVRGLSQSGGDPVLVADGNWRSDGGWSLHAGLSSLGRDRRRGDAEINLGGGFSGDVGESVSWKLAATGYRVLGGGESRRPAYGELSAGLGWRGRLQALLVWAPRYPALRRAGAAGGAGPPRGRAVFAEASWRQPLGAGWSADAGLGHADYRIAGFTDYSYGSVGLGWQRGPLQVLASRIFSSSAAQAAVGPRAVVSVLWAF